MKQMPLISGYVGFAMSTVALFLSARNTVILAEESRTSVTSSSVEISSPEKAPETANADADIQGEDVTDSTTPTTHEQERPADVLPVLPSEASAPLLVPSVANKRMIKSRFTSYVSFDLAWDTAALPKPTRAVKGTLVVLDLFDEVIFQLKMTIDDPLTPGTPYEQKGVMFEFNQFIEAHQVVAGKDLKDLKFRFEIEAVLYEDGSTKP